MSRVRNLVAAALMSAQVFACGGASRNEPVVEVTSVSESQASDANRDLSPREARAALRRGLAALEQGDPSRATRSLEPIAEHPEFGATASYHLGVAAQIEGHGGEAARYYRLAFDQDPTLTQALASLVRLRLSSGDVDGAQMDYQRALARSQNAPSVRAVGLQIRLQRGDYEGVIREARDVLLYEEGNIDAHLALALAYNELGQTELAKLVLREALNRDSERADLWLVMANIQIAQDNEVAAIQSLRELLAVDANFVEGHNNLGVLLHRARNNAEALEHLERAVELRPDYVEAWLNLSNALKASRQLVEAEAAIQRALLVDPRFADAYFNLGLLYLDTELPGMTRIERLEASVEHFNRYRSEMGPRLTRDDPVEAYINEALAAIEADTMFEQSGGGEPDGDDPFGEPEEWEEDEWEEDEWE